MKTYSSIKIRCKNCLFIKRGKTIFVFCKTLKHKQRQG